MAYWLMKSEPDSWSWDHQVKAGAKGAEWTGVRNHTAKQNLMKMKKGDRAFFYHSNVGKEIVGVVEVLREHHPDPTAEKASPGGGRRGAGAHAATGDARRHQERAKAERYGAGQTIAPVGGAGDGGRMEADLQDGRNEVGGRQ